MSSPQETDNQIPKDIPVIRVIDPVALYLMQQLGIETDSEPIILTKEEEQRLAELQFKVAEESQLKTLVDEIFVEVPNITVEQCEELLMEVGANRGALDVALDYFRTKQLMHGVKSMRVTDPETLDLMKRFGIRTDDEE